MNQILLEGDKMSYEFELIKKEQLQVLKWSGGTTTQLAIFPKDAVYDERNFKWRLSTASVEVSESVFTKLPNIKRIIMVIEGNLILEHEGHHKIILQTFDQDHFSGNWHTTSLGQATDFNLMLSEGFEGELEAIFLEKDQSKINFFDNKQKDMHYVHAIYCVNGKVKIEIACEKMMVLEKGDIILITLIKNCEDLCYKIYHEEEIKADLIIAKIHD